MPDSEVYPLLSTLPPPDPTNPTGSATFDAQDAIHNGFRVLQEVLSLIESQEEDTLKREVERRRTRLGAAGLEQIKKEVYLEISAKSQVSLHCDNYSYLIMKTNLFLASRTVRCHLESSQHVG
jgi:superkiller protein 3